jgi:hypothetical protein
MAIDGTLQPYWLPERLFIPLALSRAFCELLSTFCFRDFRQPVDCCSVMASHVSGGEPAMSGVSVDRLVILIAVVLVAAGGAFGWSK